MLMFLPHVRGWSEAINRCWFTKISIKYRWFYTGRLFCIVKSFPPYRWYKGRDRRRRDVSTYRPTLWISLSLNTWNASKQVLLLISKCDDFIHALLISVVLQYNKISWEEIIFGWYKPLYFWITRDHYT